MHIATLLLFSSLFWKVSYCQIDPNEQTWKYDQTYSGKGRLGQNNATWHVNQVQNDQQLQQQQQNGQNNQAGNASPGSQGLPYGCIPLRNSTACKAFKDYYVGLPGVEYLYDFLAGVRNVDTFDNRMRYQASSKDLYLSQLGCLDTNYNPTVKYARYSLTQLCALVIFDNKFSLPCNYQYNQYPVPMCSSTCEAFVDSVGNITSDPSTCKNTTARNQAYSVMRSSCDRTPAFNGNSTESCISGTVNEDTLCGYVDSVDACAYCTANPKDTCCTKLVDLCDIRQPGGPNFIAIIVSIVCGLLVVIALVVAYWWFCFRKKMKTRADQFTFKEYDFDEDQRIYSRLGDVPGNRSTSDSNKMAASTLAPSPVFTPQAALKPDTPSWDEVPPATEEFHLVIHPYPAQLADELMLQIGDIVYLSTRFDDGWAVGYNVATGLRGVFPLICTVLASSDLMDDLLQGETSSKTLVEHGQSPLLRQCQLPSQQQQFTLRMARIRENLQRSRSLGVLSHMLPRSTPPLAHHNTIPKRAASMRAPPFTDVTPLSSALVRPRNVERHALVETQKPDEVYELHQQNHH